MKANELRIGNYVYHPMRDEHFAIDRGLFEYNNGLANLEDFRPIPLTEEWLKDFGFEKSVDKYQEGISYGLEAEFGIHIVFADGDINYCSLYQNYQLIDFFTGHIKYVHQLQNLYFALTGKELEKK